MPASDRGHSGYGPLYTPNRHQFALIDELLRLARMHDNEHHKAEIVTILATINACRIGSAVHQADLTGFRNRGDSLCGLELDPIRGLVGQTEDVDRSTLRHRDVNCPACRILRRPLASSHDHYVLDRHQCKALDHV